MNKEEWEDYLKLAGSITDELDNTSVYENWLIIQEYIDRQQSRFNDVRNYIKQSDLDKMLWGKELMKILDREE